MKVLLLGIGYWGRNYSRDLRTCQGITGVATVDPVNPDADYKCVTDAPDDFDGAVVACPASLHADALCELTTKSKIKTVLVEKPLTTTLCQLSKCYQMAKECQWKLMVGHTFMHHKTVSAMFTETNQQWFGDITTVYAKRTNLGPVRSDVGAHWDLAPHDLSMIVTLMARHAYVYKQVTAHSARSGTVFMTLDFVHETKPPVVCHIHVSWEEPNKERRLVAVGTGGKVEFNDVANPNAYSLYTVDGRNDTVEVKAKVSPLQQQIATWVAGDFDMDLDKALAGTIISILETVDYLLF